VSCQKEEKIKRKNLEMKAKKAYSEYIKTLNKAFKTIGLKENEFSKAIELSDKKLSDCMQRIRKDTIALKRGLKRLGK
jgi:predicted transcriptional regulator